MCSSQSDDPNCSYVFVNDASTEDLETAFADITSHLRTARRVNWPRATTTVPIAHCPTLVERAGQSLGDFHDVAGEFGNRITFRVLVRSREE